MLNPNFGIEVEKNYPVLTPTGKNWLESGQLLGIIYKENGFSPQKLRDLHFDVLIVLTARSYGAQVVTSNRSDFELISQHRKVDRDIWP